MDKRRVHCIAEGRYFHNFKECLRYLGLEEEFTSSQRTRMRQAMKRGHVIEVRGYFICPVIEPALRYSI